jgi:hypothetical protein
VRKDEERERCLDVCGHVDTKMYRSGWSSVQSILSPPTTNSSPGLADGQDRNGACLCLSDEFIGVETKVEREIELDREEGVE